MIYFIRDNAAGAVKIGTADDPAKRLRMLQCGNPNPLQLVGAIPGGAADEKRLHREYREFHKRGEWFHWTRAMVEAVGGLVDRYGVDPSARRLPAFLYAADFPDSQWAAMTRAVRAALIAETRLPCTVYWGSEPFMSDADRTRSYQVMPDVNAENHPFWDWHLDNAEQWYATPGHAADAWVQSFRFWSDRVAKGQSA